MSMTILTVPAGTSQSFTSPVSSQALQPPLSIAGFPGVGGSWTVEQMVSVGGTWDPVTSGNLTGTLTAKAKDSLISPVYALRFTAITQALTVEIAQ